MAKQLPAGTRIRFFKALTAPATGDHPAFLYALRGGEGEVVERDRPCSEGHWVKWDSWPEPFGAVLGVEFEVIGKRCVDG